MYIMAMFKRSDGQEHNKYHELVVPLIFVALWVAGLAITFINPLLPYLNTSNPCSAILSSFVYIYVVFIIEVFVTFIDINYVYHPYKAGKYLWKIVYSRILPNIAFTILAFVWYYRHQSGFWLIPFVVLSAIIKWREVWLANNGETVFMESQKTARQDNILKPKTLILKKEK